MKSGILVIMLLLLFTTSACVDLGPKPDILDYYSSDGWDNSDHVVYITCRVINNGRDGTVTVTAALATYESYWEKEEKAFIASGQTEDIIIAFQEAELLSYDLYECRYRVEVKP
jgi:hypothetical protein